MSQTIETPAPFDVNSLPDLDVVVFEALDLIGESLLPDAWPHFKKPIVIGSVNAAATGRIIFADTEAVFADESTYEDVLNKVTGIDGAVVVSASGSKHSILIAKTLKNKGIDSVLFTNNPAAPAKEFFADDRVFTFPRNIEPYTYNTSTYLSMIFSKTKESAIETKSFIKNEVEPKLLRNFGCYSAFTIIVPAKFSEIRSMLRTKFDELFGPHIVGRIFTEEEVKHAKTVVTSGDELFISLGVKNEHYGLVSNRLSVAIPKEAGYGSMLAISYFVIGQIQKAHPPYFKNCIVKYTQDATKIFGQTISPIVK